MNVEVIQPQWPAPPWVRAAASTRSGGGSRDAYASLNLALHCGDDDAAVRANRRAWQVASGMPAQPAWMQQVHGRNVAQEPDGHAVPVADAAVATQPRRPLVVMTADCLPILLACRRRRWVAVVHAGWRGLADGVIAAAAAHAAADAALDAFAADWRHDPLVMDKWRMLQATASRPDTLARVKALSEAPDFPWKTPNRFRSLVAAFAQNPYAFHQADGSGYRFLADWLIRLDPVNPQTAARVAGAFETWRRYDAKRKKLIRAELSRIAGTEGLSRDMAEIVSRMLDA